MGKSDKPGKSPLEGMAYKLMTEEQIKKAEEIKSRPDRSGHEKKNGLR